ncbi:MAG: hypothetical protein V3S41_01210 [Spirochaetia bacterium]
MKQTVLAILMVGFALAPVWADGQFRLAGNTATQVDALPTDNPAEWQELLIPTDQTMTGWHWEVIFNYLGLGMHYGVRFNDSVISTESPGDWYVDWKGDFFLSYHVLGGGSIVDPFVEFGWGNVGTALVSSPEFADYPNWEDEVARGAAVALGFYNYFAGGLAVDLNGLLLGAKVSYIPSELAGPVTGGSIERYALAPFEVSLFGGVALGGHRDQRHRPHRH